MVGKNRIVYWFTMMFGKVMIVHQFHWQNLYYLLPLLSLCFLTSVNIIPLTSKTLATSVISLKCSLTAPPPLPLLAIDSQFLTIYYHLSIKIILKWIFVWRKEMMLLNSCNLFDISFFHENRCKSSNGREREKKK